MIKGDRDFLLEHLETVPAFRALLRAIEARKMSAVEFARPVLDFGCGDGNFAAMTFSDPLDVGVDPSRTAIEEARGTGMYRELCLTDGRFIPYPDGYFASALSNSVLEHITDLDENLSEVHRVLKPGALFAFTTPSHHFAEYLFFPTLMRTFGLLKASRAYENYFNRISRHYRTDSPDIWRKRLEQHGFRIVECYTYFTASSSRLFDLMHYYSAPAILYKKLFRRWILAPYRWNFAHILPTFRWHVESADTPEGAYIFVICEKA
jgi:SAM-dependent methyltransferase